MEESRETLAAQLGARPSEMIFTAGGTESDNLAVKGIFWARRDADPRRRRIVTSAVEHHAVLDAVEWLAEHEGAEVTWLPTDADGSVTPAALRDALAAARRRRAGHRSCGPTTRSARSCRSPSWPRVAAEFGVPMHSDAVQAVGQMPVEFAD